MTKLKCFTKERNDKSLYTTCVQGQKKPKAKAKAKAKEPAFSFGDVVGKVGGGTKEKGYREPAKPKAKPKVPKITITEAPKKKKLIIKEVDKPTPYKPTVKKLKIGKEPAKPKKEPAKPKKEPAKPKVNKFEEIDKEMEYQYQKYKEQNEEDGGAGAGAGAGAGDGGRGVGKYKDFLLHELGNTTSGSGTTYRARPTYGYQTRPIPKGYADELVKQIIDEIKKKFPVGSKQKIRHGRTGDDGNIKFTSGERLIKKYTKTALEVEENYGVGDDRTKKRTFLFKDIKKRKGEFQQLLFAP